MSTATNQSFSGPTSRTGLKTERRQLNNRFDPHTALTKSQRPQKIQKFPGKNGVKKNIDVPAVLAKFEDLLLKYF